MKNILIVIIIILMLLPNSSGPSVVSADVSAEDFEAYGIAGALAMLPGKEATPDVPVPVPTPPTPVTDECKCVNGKVSYDGGTSLTDCPCKNSDKNCGCKKAAKEIPDLFPRTVLVTQPSVCAPCVSVDKNIVARLRNEGHKKAGWDVGPEAFNDFQVLDLDDEFASAEIKRLNLSYTAIPTFFYIKSDGVKKIHTGSMSYDSYIKWSKKN
jgi:hypothetical protein